MPLPLFARLLFYTNPIKHPTCIHYNLISRGFAVMASKSTISRPADFVDFLHASPTRKLHHRAYQQLQFRHGQLGI